MPDDPARLAIRPARPSDLDAIAAVQRASILALTADAYGAEAAAAWARDTVVRAPTLLDGGTFFVAEDAAGQRVVGVGGWSPREGQPDGAWVLTASDDRTAVLWNAATGEVVRTFKGHADRVRSAVFSFASTPM